MKDCKCPCQAYEDAGNKPRTVFTYGSTVVWYKAETKKPLKFKNVLVAGGCAYWDGENWITCMEQGKNRIIQWDVKWWAELPKPPEV